ncbi:MAG: PhoX family phosphatase [Pseudomonadota bacterium]|nr:PhoX family phosphatase [Pseudomonadota bacterium]
MKGNSHPKNDVTINPSSNESIHQVIERIDPSRRQFLHTGIGAAALASAGGLTLSGLSRTVEAHGLDRGPPFGQPGIGFAPVPAHIAPLADKVTVPAGYTAQLFVAWGDPIMPGGKAFRGDATETALDQLLQFGEHCDGMHFFPLGGEQGPTDAGLLCINNEYTHEEILYPDGQVGSGYNIAKTRKSQAAHGVSVVEARRVVEKDRKGRVMSARWVVNRRSRFGRRITANTPMRISGPAAGHPLMQTREFLIRRDGSEPTGGTTDGRWAFGTINNCANGFTPWGTFLTCEENWNGNFGGTGAVDTSAATEIGKLNRRYGIAAAGFGYRWHETDPRFDVTTNPNEPHHFGWVVEIDPREPHSPPVKRTALGRFKHESAQHVVDEDDRLALYMGDDERNEYIYKFVSAGRFRHPSDRRNRELLDKGTLFVARFNADLTGQWIPLLPGTLGIDGVTLRDNPNFAGADDAEVLAKILIKTRMAADAVGATMMDRPEWTGARPRTRGFREVEVYCTLTNNNRRGTSTPSANAADGSTAAGSARPPVDAANPREDNIYGHIIRWREDGRSVAATSFRWDLFVQNGDTATARAAKPTNDYRGNIADSPEGSADYGAPDGLWFDPWGRLWVQTDQAGNAAGDWLNIGTNCMVCVDPATGATRRFLTAPPNAEVTGVTMTPDGRAMFVGIQHPGEDSTAANPTQYSSWPQSQWTTTSDGQTVLPAGRPRSGVVVITKDDGGIIGT